MSDAIIGARVVTTRKKSTGALGALESSPRAARWKEAV